MHLIDLYIPPGDYENPLSPSGRGRTIAAFHLAQGDAEQLGHSEMRRDVLNSLMSSSAVNHWLNNTSRLEKTRKIGTTQLVRLTDAGLVECNNSLNGGGNVTTTRELVEAWRLRMRDGAPGFYRKCFRPLESEGSDGATNATSLRTEPKAR
jgi:hypothetical protein